ncbi:MAG TPA: hypothetical protein VH062_20055 [Polyangiaceae bacterium]|nr:hypothetical protein [Polyangiaceae bacterium]
MVKVPDVGGNQEQDASTAVMLWTESARAARAPSPALVAFSGERAAFRTIEFLTAGIHNDHTPRAYHRAARQFLAWCNRKHLGLPDVTSPDVARYVVSAAQTPSFAT